MAYCGGTLEEFRLGWAFKSQLDPNLVFPPVPEPPPVPASFSTLIDDVMNILRDDEGNKLTAQE